MIVDDRTLTFGLVCSDIDCFTLECPGIQTRPDSDSTIIVIESVSGIPVGPDVEDVIFSGLPDGRIIIDGEDFQLDCNGIIVP